jgi:hypothetical protein
MGSPGFSFQAGGGEAAVHQVGVVLDLLQLALDDADQAWSAAAKLVMDRLSSDQMPSAGFMSGAYAGSWYTRSHSLFSCAKPASSGARWVVRPAQDAGRWFLFPLFGAGLTTHISAVIRTYQRAAVVKNRLKRIQYRPNSSRGFLAQTGLTLKPEPP